MIAHYLANCKLCGSKDNYLAWHPIWQGKEICYKCRDKMYLKHKVWMDRLLEKKRKLWQAMEIIDDTRTD